MEVLLFLNIAILPPKKYVRVCTPFNPFITSPGFYVSAVQVVRKHWEKEKLLVTSNFSFSQSVFNPSGELLAIVIKFKIVVCKDFRFGSLKFVVISSDNTTNNTESLSKALSVDSDRPSGNQTCTVNNREIQDKAANIA